MLTKADNNIKMTCMTTYDFPLKTIIKWETDNTAQIPVKTSNLVEDFTVLTHIVNIYLVKQITQTVSVIECSICWADWTAVLTLCHTGWTDIPSCAIIREKNKFTPIGKLKEAAVINFLLHNLNCRRLILMLWPHLTIDYGSLG